MNGRRHTAGFEHQGAHGTTRRLAPLLFWVVVLLVSFAPASATAERIQGSLRGFEQLRNPVWEAAKDLENHGYYFRELVPTVPARFRQLFPHIPKEICVAAIGATDQPKLPPVLVNVGGGRTTPVTLVVPPGTQLTFKNADPFTHRLYGAGMKTFAAAETQRGGTRDWTVPGPGVFEIRDELAPSLRMWVIGEPKVVGIAYPSMGGQFRVTVPGPGDYVIQPYFAGQKVGAPRAVTVDGKDVDLSRAPIDVAPKKKQQK